MKRIFYPFMSLVICALLAAQFSQAQSYTMFDPSSAPPGGPFGAQANAVDYPDFTPIQGIETGIRFKVTQIGTISAIRFYKGNTNTGTHIGNLWEPGFSTVTPRRTVTFTGESATGWQQMNFSTPFAAAPNTVFVASVFSPTGTYAYDDGYINPSADVTAPPFVILAGDGTTDPSGIGNGSFLYTNPSAFPSNPNGSGYFSTNFFIDIVFTPTFSLPVTLTDFKAITNNSDISLSWKTESEHNNRGFEIQRSNNSSDWYTLGFIDGHGDSYITRNYAYTDKGLAPGTYYYRLKQTDYDGKSNFSPIVSAAVGGKGHVSLFQNYPNPFHGSTTIRFDLPETQKIKLSVFDMTGKEIKVLANEAAAAGSHLVTLDAALLQRQVYILRLQTEKGEVLTKQILVD